MAKVEKMQIDFNVPEYLEKDIDALCEIIDRDGLYDCEESEVYGSINMAMISGEITVEQAEVLRDYYLNGGMWSGK